MKRIILTVLTIHTILTSNSQIVLNEIYCNPGAGKNEFFELYNISGGNTPMSVDNISVLVYFIDPDGKKGFYVLDLPNLNVEPKGYFVGSSAKPFHYQGVNNSNSTNFSWNDLVFLAANNGYLKKWVQSSLIPALIDGNQFYDEATLPANFNDFFDNVESQEGNYCVFVYMGGVLQNSFIGGIGGNTGAPSFITAMPELYVDMSATGTDFKLIFSGYSNVPTEEVIPEAGSDNGYRRTKDGMCGTWMKSSNQTSHTPGVSNGAHSTGSGVVTISNAITRGDATTGSVLTYDVINAPASELPVTLHVYLDNGSIPEQLDGEDAFIESRLVTNVTEAPNQVTFFPYDANVIIVAMTSAGCIDKVLFTPNSIALPVRLISFSGNMEAFNWVIEINEDGKEFDLERSHNGIDFHLEAKVLASGKQGKEVYKIANPATRGGYYRLKMVNTNGSVQYSNIIFIKEKPENNKGELIMKNPVYLLVDFTYKTVESTRAEVKIYNQMGTILVKSNVFCYDGVTNITIRETARLAPGTYLLEFNTGKDRIIKKFIKL